MLIDARQIVAGSCLRPDLCIVGAGVAGLAAALALEPTCLRILVLEAGGQRFAAVDQADAGGTSAIALDLPLQSYPFQASRVRGLGGTSERWSGACLPLDAADFHKRAWLPDSGWPCSANDLQPYLQQAAGFLGLPRVDLEAPPPGSAFPACGLELRRVLFPHRGALRLGQRHGQQLRRARHLTVITHAAVQELLPDPGNSRIEALTVVGPGQPGFRVEPTLVVLAAGGLENARLLLVSRSRDRRGVGNRYDQVGRYFMEHDYRAVGLLAVGQAWQQLLPLMASRTVVDRSGRRGRCLGTLGLAARLRQRHGLLNLHLRGYRYHPLEAHPAVLAGKALLRHPAGAAPFAQRHLLRHADLLARYLGWHGFGKLRPDHPCAWIRLMGWREQEPQAHNRVTLSTHLDSHGWPLAHLELRFSARMQDSLERSLALIGAALRQQGSGALLSDPELLVHLQSPAKVGCHHMGGTRMHDDPRQGVVDHHCRVHGIDNLYIAGSSVFPTAGSANPTLTLTALSLRLADHLRGQRFGCG